MTARAKKGGLFRESLGNSPKKLTSCVHVAFGVNERYVFPMGVAITSILENNPDLPMRFHVFATSISGSDLARLRSLERQYDVKVELYSVDEEFLDEFADVEYVAHLNAASFIRILAPYQLAGVAERILYLDSDIICQGRLDELVTLDLEGAVSACVADFPEVQKQQCMKLDLEHGQYFNSGVMLIDTARWNEERITQRVFTIVKAQKSFAFADQDVLNRLLDGRVRFIDDRWNFLQNAYDKYRQGEMAFPVAKDAVFVHFVGQMKPWHLVSLPDAQDLFLKYKKTSPWARTSLEKPGDARLIRKFAKLLNSKGYGRRATKVRLWYLLIKLAELAGRVLGKKTERA